MVVGGGVRRADLNCSPLGQPDFVDPLLGTEEGPPDSPARKAVYPIPYRCGSRAWGPTVSTDSTISRKT